MRHCSTISTYCARELGRDRQRKRVGEFFHISRSRILFARYKLHLLRATHRLAGTDGLGLAVVLRWSTMRYGLSSQGTAVIALCSVPIAVKKISARGRRYNRGFISRLRGVKKDLNMQKIYTYADEGMRVSFVFDMKCLVEVPSRSTYRLPIFW
ncbi:hypothetical protein C8Q69DRAFT_480037 [Paecilomyces variotii]|uniref:Uncharacterized protein n=1 Tax=Byssochlamys spectabilis TaxID=264951 RepID=A0A443HK45_BYSSP|nr:hypothetical protein C8Q69DRAFT_480037 [Paecilomyces variotii]RWQ92159.1 hypothetical protein C8Q69DRAFT_480037 [Paecilomyces variotii]